MSIQTVVGNGISDDTNSRGWYLGGLLLVIIFQGVLHIKVTHQPKSVRFIYTQSKDSLLYFKHGARVYPPFLATFDDPKNELSRRHPDG